MKRLEMLGLALLLAGGAAKAEAQRRITGRVTGSAGEPVSSATVSVQGSSIGGYSAEDGRFAINNAPAGAQTLTVRRLGYRRTTVLVPATSDNVEVKLERDVLELETQVVTGTATTVSSRNAATSVAVVSGSQLNQAPTPTIENALQGKIAGAVITTNSGAPGGGAQVQLRGVNSVYAGSSPLYVVDGVILDNATIGTGLSQITNAGGAIVPLGVANPQDQAVNRIADLNPADVENIEVLKGPAGGAIYGSKGTNGVIIITTKRGTAGSPTVSFAQRFGQFSLAKKLGSRCFGSAAEVDGAGFDSTGFGAAAVKCHDYEQEFFSGNAPSYETNMSVRGGAAGSTYYIGGLVKRDNAIQPNTFYQKQGLTANLGQLIGTRFNLHANNQFVHSLADRGVSGNDNSPVVSPLDVISNTPSFFDLKATSNGQYQPNPFLGEGTNIFQTAALARNPEDVYRYVGSLNGTLSVLASSRQTIDVTFLGGLDSYQFNSHLYYPPELFFEAADGLPGTVLTNKTSVSNTNLSATAQYKRIFDNATATTSLGLRQERRSQDGIYNLGKNIPAGVEDIQFGVQQFPVEARQLVKDAAFYGQEDLLLFDEHLFLTAALNAERSSVNGDDRKFYTFPKFAASYRLVSLPASIDELKLRLSYGKAGNQPPYGYRTTALNYTTYGAQPALKATVTRGDSAIRPELSTEVEGGMDVQFFGGRVALEATAFRKDVNDIILLGGNAPTSGVTVNILNGGAIRNTGTEFGLSATPVQAGNRSWVTRTTFARVQGTFTRLDVPGFLCGAAFSLRYGSPFCEQGRSTTTMQYYDGFDTTSTTPLVRSRHISYLDYAPKFTMGFSNEVNLGKLRLYGLLDWRRGGYTVNLTQNYFDGSGLSADTTAQNERVLQFFTNGRAIYLEPAGFVKLRELSVGYELPAVVTQSLFAGKAQSVRLEVSGRNLKTWTSYTGYDPEVSNFGNASIRTNQDVTPYPPSRSFFVSLAANF